MRRLAVLLAVFALGCGDSTGGPFIIANPGNAGPSKARFFHASPDAPNLQLLTDGQADLGEIAYTSVTPYISINNASVELTLNSALSANPIIDTIVTLADSSLNTIIAEGPDAAVHLRFVIDAKPTLGSVLLRVLHEAPAGGSLDLYITAPLADLTALTPTVAGITFGADTPYQVVVPGTIQVRLTAAGTKTVVLDSGSLPLGGGDVRSFVVLDATSGGLPLQSRILLDAGT